MAMEIRSGEVSATFTITADSPGSLGRMIAAIGRALESMDAGAAPAAPTDAASPEAWYRTHGREFYDRLQPTAQLALRTVVAEGPTVPMQMVINATGRDGSRLAGSLASVGAAVRRMNAPAPPFVADHKRKVYTADAGVLEALRDVIPELQA